MKTVVLQGSSRVPGNTNEVLEYLKEHLDFDQINLREYQITHYDYTHQNHEDDFLALIRKIVQEYDLIILATPVYWYSMSGLTKVFLDRISDCLHFEKETGRKLRGKKLAAVSCGSEKTEIEGFFVPFQLSAQYLGMAYLGSVHTWKDDSLPLEAEVKNRLQAFAQALET